MYHAVIRIASDDSCGGGLGTRLRGEDVPDCFLGYQEQGGRGAGKMSK